MGESDQQEVPRGTHQIFADAEAFLHSCPIVARARIPLTSSIYLTYHVVMYELDKPYMLRPYLVPGEARKILRICAKTMYQYLREGRIKAIKLHGVWRIPQSEVAEEEIRRGRMPSFELNREKKS